MYIVDACVGKPKKLIFYFENHEYHMFKTAGCPLESGFEIKTHTGTLVLKLSKA